MAKLIKYNMKAREAMLNGVRTLADMDPTKVALLALQNAANVASLMLTTEAMVSEKPAEKKGMHPGAQGMGGGMGGMM